MPGVPVTLGWNYDLAGDPGSTKQFDTFIQDPVTGTINIDDPDTGTDDGRLFLTVSILGNTMGSFFWQDIFGVGAANNMRLNLFRVSFCVGVLFGPIPATCPGSGNSGISLITNVIRPRP